MKERTGDDWIPLWIDKWLFGSTRIELEPAQRSVWIDLLVLAGKDTGHIRANAGVPFQDEQLSGLLCISKKLLRDTITKCIDTGKLSLLKDGTLLVKNWDNYSLSKRHQRRVMSGQSDATSSQTDITSAKEDTTSEVADTRVEKSREEKNREEERRGEENISPPPLFSDLPEGMYEVVSLWNSIPNLSQIRTVDGRRRDRLQVLVDSYTSEDIRRALEIIARTPFLLGDNDRGWKCTIDWIVTPGNVTKVLEGQYDGGSSPEENQEKARIARGIRESEQRQREKDEWKGEQAEKDRIADIAARLTAEEIERLRSTAKRRAIERLKEQGLNTESFGWDKLVQVDTDREFMDLVRQQFKG